MLKHEKQKNREKENMKDKYKLIMRYGISKGRETYGYNTISLRDCEDERRVGFVSGGGYDMHGAVIGEWVEKEFSEELKLLDPKKYYGLRTAGEYYGLRTVGEKGIIHVDRACGIESVEKILKGLGFSLWSPGAQGNYRFYFVERVQKTNQ